MLFLLLLFLPFFLLLFLFFFRLAFGFLSLLFLSGLLLGFLLLLDLLRSLRIRLGFGFRFLLLGFFLELLL